jgi:hypothetical protein
VADVVFRGLKEETRYSLPNRFRWIIISFFDQGAFLDADQFVVEGSGEFFFQGGVIAGVFVVGFGSHVVVAIEIT